MNWEREWEKFYLAFRKTPWPSLSKRAVLMEIIANGVAGLCALIVYMILQQFFVVKSVKNLWGLAARKDKMLISKDAFEWTSGILVFVIALFVFTYVENLIEKYLEERSKP